MDWPIGAGQNGNNMSTGYSDAQLDRIASDIVAESTEKHRSDRVFMDKKYVQDDWDDELFISENLYEDFLRSCQQEKTSAVTKRAWDSMSTFEQYLQDCLITLDVRMGELSAEANFNIIDQRTYLMAKETVQRSVGAIRCYLEKDERRRLIGV